MAKNRIFFMCSTVIEVDELMAKEFVKNGMGKFREDAHIMNEALFGSGVDILAYPTYDEWKEFSKDVDHKVVGDFNVANYVANRLGTKWSN